MTTPINLPSPAMVKAVAEYARTCGANGPDSTQTRAVRERHAGIVGFGEYADALDGIKRGLGGSPARPPSLMPEHKRTDTESVYYGEIAADVD